MTSPVQLSVVIVNWNGGDHLLACLRSVFESAGGAALEVWLVDNASSDRSADRAVAAYPEVRLIQNRDNLGFARAANQALAQASGDSLLLLNPDARVTPEALAALLAAMRADPQVGIAGCPSVGPQGERTPGCEHSYPGRRKRPLPPPASGSPTAPAEVAWVSGACLLARRAMAEEIGLLDAGFFMYYEDVDWCYRARQAGWKVVTVPGVAIYHQLGGASAQASAELTARRVITSRLRFFRKHYSAARAGWLTAGVVASSLAGCLACLPLSLFSRPARQALRLHVARLLAAVCSGKE